MSVTYEPNPVHVRDKVVFTQVIRNEGRDTVRGGTFNVDLYVDGRRVAFDHGTSNLPAGKSVTYSMAPGYFNWQPTKAGRHHYRFVVDEHNTVPEQNKKNNVIEGDINVGNDQYYPARKNKTATLSTGSLGPVNITLPSGSVLTESTLNVPDDWLETLFPKKMNPYIDRYDDGSIRGVFAVNNKGDFRGRGSNAFRKRRQTNVGGLLRWQA